MEMDQELNNYSKFKIYQFGHMLPVYVYVDMHACA